MRIRRACNAAGDAGKIKLQAAFVLHAGQAVSPQTGVPGIGFDQLHLLRLPARQPEVGNRLLVDGEHGGCGPILRRHVGDGGTVANREAARAFSVKLQISAHHFLLAQKLGESQHDVRGCNALLALAGELHANDFRQAHP